MSLRLDWISHRAARFAAQRWHYSKRMPTPPAVYIGVWEDGRYIGAVIFSRGASSHLGDAYGLDTTQVCELTRVALTKHAAPVSKIVAVAIRMLRKKAPGLRLIVSFADPMHGHHGGIYQAGNWLYFGATRPTFMYRDPAGRVWHNRQVSSSGFKRQYGQKRRVWKPSECERIACPGKHRYTMPLDDAMREKIRRTVQPYPKRGGSDTDDTPGHPPGKGGSTPTPPLQPLT